MTDTLDRPKVHYIRTLAAAKLFAHLKDTGDSLMATHTGKRTTWSMTRSGKAVDPRAVEQLVRDDALVPYGVSILDESPACLVVNEAVKEIHLGSPEADEDDEEEADAAPPSREAAVHLGPSPTACGSFSRDDCDRRGWCRDCAPPEILKNARKGECKNWHGPSPDADA